MTQTLLSHDRFYDGDGLLGWWHLQDSPVSCSTGKRLCLSTVSEPTLAFRDSTVTPRLKCIFSHCH